MSHASGPAGSDSLFGPSNWASPPPAAALAWAARSIAPGARVVRVRALPGGHWLATHLLVIDHPAGAPTEAVLRRWARPGWELDNPTFTAAAEAAVLERLARTRIPAPLVLAADPDATPVDVPALLQSRLPGRPPTYPATRRIAVLRQLAELLVGIHGLGVGREPAVQPHAPHASLERIAEDLPAASTDRALWNAALEVAADPPAVTRATLLHRDYHPGNTLWRAGRLTGIVDWTGASWGPPAADLAHLRANLGVGHEPAIADHSLALYEEAGGTAADQRWWDVRVLLDWVPLLGERLGTGEGLKRVERWLAHVLG